MRGTAAPPGGVAVGLEPPARGRIKRHASSPSRSAAVALARAAHMHPITLALPAHAEDAYLLDAWGTNGTIAFVCAFVYALLSLGLGVAALDGADGGAVVLAVILRIVPGVVAAGWGAALIVGGMSEQAGPALRLWSPVMALLGAASSVGIAAQARYCVNETLAAASCPDPETLPWLAVAWALVLPHVLVHGMLVRWHHATAAAIVGSAVALGLLLPGAQSSGINTPRPAEGIVTFLANIAIVGLMGHKADRLARTFHLAQLSDAADGDGRARGAGVRGHGLLASVQHSPNVLLLKTELDGTVVFASEAASHVHGYDDHELEGRHLDEFVVTADRRALRDAIEAGRANPKQPFTATYHRVGKRGGSRLVRLHAFFMTRHDEPSSIVGFEWQESSPSPSAAGAAAPSTAASPEASRRRQENEVVMSFASHELYNSLHVLDATCATMADDPKLEDYREDFEDIVSAGKTVHLLVSDLLALVKLADGSLATHPEVIDTEALIQKVVNEQKPLTKLPIVVTIDPKVPTKLTLDGENTALLLANALNASVRSVDSGEIRVVVDLESDKKLRIDIVDEGTLDGATKEDLERALADGKPVEGTRQRRTALLLPVCNQVAEALLGTVSIEETSGYLHFSFIVPFTRVGGRGGAGAGGVAAAGAPQPPSVAGVAGMYVMLVDDSKMLRRTGGQMLERLGCTYKLLEDGDEVVGALAEAERPFDCILLDIKMERTDGAVVCSKLREIHGARLPIVAMTSHTEARDVDRFMSMGFDLVLGKPFSVQDLGNALLKGRMARGTARFSRMSARTDEPAGRLDDPHRHAFTTRQEAIDEAGGDLPDAFEDEIVDGGGGSSRALPGAVRK
uniref:Response regulatory domain-containing protein n=1 Tax=Bicosoecida sp. CB-2014 TaxID=1486930 RepID=A0A7S1CF04_9STRA|mmetsp:Transcript_21755/g.76375  ORF Transcript_21755/g.76375 Transcript_21755/m.76375 type:complete len:854 (-) Transcript_21755:259-2820(-)